MSGTQRADSSGSSNVLLNTARLDAYIRKELGGLDGELLLESIAGGQSNPTFFVSYGNRRLVLRKQPQGHTLPSAHAVDREYRIMAALGRSDVPVPGMVLFCNDREVVGTPFYLMDRLEGRVFSDCTLPGIASADRRAMYLAMAETLARLHRVDWAASGLSDYGRPGNYFARQIDRWTRQWTLSKTREIPQIDQLVRWLPDQIPADDTTTIAHGDFRIGNLMFHPTQPRVVGVLDWELSTLGHPLADLAFSALAWRLKPDEHMGMRGCDLDALGIPTEQEYLEHYYRHAGTTQQVLPFHFAFALFRLAVIFEGIAARARSGAAVADNAAEIGKLSLTFARRAIEVIEGEQTGA
jgi:aminoglycoside phosphotransferase (APT) family kinase protein